MPPLTYANYLDLETLLTMQKPRSTPAEHDEMLFIIIHQTYELWFKQLLHEFEKIKSDFSAGDLFGAIHSFKRVRTIMKVLVAQVDILGYDRLQQLLNERTVIDHFYDFLKTRGAQIPADLKNRDLTEPNGPNEKVQKEILRLYKSSPELTILLELMTDFDEGLQEWRYRHIKLVERTIGAKKGTGG